MEATRRKFLGLLVAAPVGAAMLGKSAASPRFHSGISLGQVGEFTFVGERTGESLLTPAQARHLNAALNRPIGAPNEKLRLMLRASPPWAAPNRLFGASVNEDGDAI